MGNGQRAKRGFVCVWVLQPKIEFGFASSSFRFLGEHTLGKTGATVRVIRRCLRECALRNRSEMLCVCAMLARLVETTHATAPERCTNETDWWLFHG